MRVQMFEATSVGGKEELYRFKEGVNRWLEDNEGKLIIREIRQNMCAKASSHLYLITIWYDAVEKSPSEEIDQEDKKSENPFSI